MDEANEIRIIIEECENQRELLDFALNRMHLAKTYKELEEWYDCSKFHLKELDKKLDQRIYYLRKNNGC